jgi:hypothetical protein
MEMHPDAIAAMLRDFTQKLWLNQEIPAFIL